MVSSSRWTAAAEWCGSAAPREPDSGPPGDHDLGRSGPSPECGWTARHGSRRASSRSQRVTGWQSEGPPTSSRAAQQNESHEKSPPHGSPSAPRGWHVSVIGTVGRHHVAPAPRGADRHDPPHEQGSERPALPPAPHAAASVPRIARSLDLHEPASGTRRLPRVRVCADDDPGGVPRAALAADPGALRRRVARGLAGDETVTPGCGRGRRGRSWTARADRARPPPAAGAR